MAVFFFGKMVDSGGVNRVEEDQIGVSVRCRAVRCFICN